MLNCLAILLRPPNNSENYETVFSETSFFQPLLQEKKQWWWCNWQAWRKKRTFCRQRPSCKRLQHYLMRSKLSCWTWLHFLNGRLKSENWNKRISNAIFRNRFNINNLFKATVQTLQNFYLGKFEWNYCQREVTTRQLS